MKSYAPTSPSRRHMTNVPYRGVISDVRPEKALTKRLKTHAGRNSQGRITTRHQGGGNKKLYRIIDFKQNKVGMKGIVETIEYDPYRTAFIAKIIYKNGERCYILAPTGIKVGSEIMTAEEGAVTVGNRMKIKNIPIGFQVHNIEMQPGRGGQVVRSAGSFAEILGTDSGYTDVKLSSGEVRKIPSECYASIGQVSNAEWSLTVFGKAGRSRWAGIRPTVRGTAMNPVDHPYGGGEGRQPRGTRKPKTLWGKITGGHKTRNRKKRSWKLIVKRRVTVRNK